ncbi:MAG TPA: LamG-like jellyroll fold domain-containing protein [Candidatus Paceibacterota bacterium]|nr:LamG-like jellyroll fold domain-containing protein [Candidatus Paceibacterota bacterium]
MFARCFSFSFSKKFLGSFFLVVVMGSVSLAAYFHFAHAGSPDWYDSAWNYRVKITIDHTKVGADLTDFPVYVDLSKMPAGFFQHVQSGGGDIRVTEGDGVTEVPREVVSINTASSTGELHFEAPTLSSSTDSDFYLYYGNSSASEPAASSTYGSENVWNSGYQYVSHDGGASESTSHAYTITEYGSPPSANIGIGEGHIFDGSSTYYKIQPAPITSYPFTFLVWGRHKVNTPSAGVIVSNSTVNDQSVGINFHSDNHPRPFVYSSVFNGFEANSVTLSDNEEVLAVFTASSSSDRRLYVNGVPEATATDTDPFPTSVDSLGVGALIRSYGTYSNVYYAGGVGEIRISSVARSAEWIATAYANQGSPATFETIGNEEEVAVSPTGVSMSADAVLAHLNIPAEISLSAPVDVSLRNLSTSVQSAVGSSTWRVVTNNPTGYQLTVQATSSPAMKDLADGKSFADYSETSPGIPELWNVNSGDFEFGFSAFGSDTDTSVWGNATRCTETLNDPGASNLKWRGFVGTSSIEVAHSSTVSSTTAGADTTICFGTEENNIFAPSGNYQATIVVTAVAN